MSPADIIVFKELGLEILTIDEDCKRQVQRPTMFNMPIPIYCLFCNLLGNGDTVQRLERIFPFTTEVDIKTSYEHIYLMCSLTLLTISLTWIPTLTWKLHCLRLKLQNMKKLTKRNVLCWIRKAHQWRFYPINSEH